MGSCGRGCGGRLGIGGEWLLLGLGEEGDDLGEEEEAFVDVLALLGALGAGGLDLLGAGEVDEVEDGLGDVVGRVEAADEEPEDGVGARAGVVHVGLRVVPVLLALVHQLEDLLDRLDDLVGGRLDVELLLGG